MDNGASSYLRFRDGDDNAFVSIIRDYKDGLILYLDSFTHNIYIAEELMEDTFVKIVTKKPAYHRSAAFGGRRNPALHRSCGGRRGQDRKDLRYCRSL